MPVRTDREIAVTEWHRDTLISDIDSLTAIINDMAEGREFTAGCKVIQLHHSMSHRLGDLRQSLRESEDANAIRE